MSEAAHTNGATALEQLYAVMMRLALVSHVSAASLEPSQRDSGEDIGGKRPPGGLDHTGDHQIEYRQKTAVYFQRRLKRCSTEQMVVELLAEARQALKDWMRTPIPEGQEPMPGDPQWKSYVASLAMSGKEPLGHIATRFSVSRQYLKGVIDQYADAA